MANPDTETPEETEARASELEHVAQFFNRDVAFFLTERAKRIREGNA